MENTLQAFQVLEKKIEGDYIYLVGALGCAIFGVLMPFDNEILLRLGIFLVFAGFTFSVLILYDLYKFSGLYFDWHIAHLDVFKSQNIAQSTQPETYKVEVVSHDSAGAPHIRYNYGEVKKRPSDKFIRGIWAYAQEHGGYAPEKDIRVELPALAENCEVFLAEMESRGCFVRDGDQPNSARVWNTDKSLADALQEFGYSAEDAPLPRMIG